MMEAENLARLRESQTPLLGENPELHPSDFSGVTPKKNEIQTPNLMLTPSGTPGGAGLTPRIGMTPTRSEFSLGMTPKGTPLRDELRINDDMNTPNSAKLEQQRQADLRRSLRTGLGSLPQPKNEYRIVMQPVPEDAEELEEKIEEDMSDRIAREKAEEARQQALLRKRSKVLQRKLPRPPAVSLELIRYPLMRADGDKSSFVPPTSMEQADEFIRRELLTLLEHDNAKYPPDDKVGKGKKKRPKNAANGSAVPVIEDFEEDEMQEADRLIKEEARYLCIAMGHGSEPLDEFIEAHNTCLNDLMYFPTREAYGLSSVAGNMEKVTSLQHEFESVRNKLEYGKVKIARLEKKVMVLTQGYEVRAKQSLGPQIEATFRQMDVAATEFECFIALQKQEQLAASNRINNLRDEVQKQKELEKTLQKKYGSLIEELEKKQAIMDQYRALAQQQEEIEALSRAHESTETAANETDTENCKDMPHSLEHGSVVADDPSHVGTANQQVDIVQDQGTSSHKKDMDVDSDEVHEDVKLLDATIAAENDNGKVEGTGTDGDAYNGENTLDMGAAVEISTSEGSEDKV